MNNIISSYGDEPQLIIISNFCNHYIIFDNHVKY
nr:MAG TPA: hypothetical protein [Caudoviricetes sp.]